MLPNKTSANEYARIYVLVCVNVYVYMYMYMVYLRYLLLWYHDHFEGGGGKALMYLTTLRSHFIPKGSQSRNLEAIGEAETLEEYCLLVCPSCLLSLLSWTTQAYLPRGSADTPQWDWSFHMNN